MTISVVEFLLAGMIDSDGEPLANGKIYTYEAGTTTPKATYTDSAGAVPETNPVILDSNGIKHIYADGSFKFVVKNSSDVTLYTFDNLFFGIVSDLNGVEATDAGNATARSSLITLGQVQDGNPPYVGTVAGSANAITLTTGFSMTSYITGQVFRFKATNTNTGATTVVVDGISGAKTIKKLFGAAKYDLLAGDIIANGWFEVLYDGTDMILLNRNQLIAKSNSQAQVNNSTTDTALFTTTIKGNTLGAYGKIRLTSIIQVDNATGSDQTCRLHVTLNSNEIADPGAITIPLAVAEAQAAKIECEISAQGATNSQRANALIFRNVSTAGTTAAGTASVPNVYLGGRHNSSEDSTSDMTFSVKVQFGAASVDLGAYDMGTLVEFLG